MDYGKMAYLRLDEIESKIAGSSASYKEKNTGAFFEPDVELYEKTYDLTQVNGNGNITVMVMMKIKVNSTGKIEVLIGDKPVGRNEIGNLTENSCFIMSSILINEESMLSIKCFDGLNIILKSVELILIGGNAEIARAASDFKADETYDKIAMLTSASETLSLAVMNKNAVDLTGSINIGYGSRCDITVFGNKFYIVYIDSYENMWGLITEDGQNIERVYLGETADRVGLTADGTSIIIAVIKNKKLYYFMTDTSFKSKSALIPVDTVAAPEKVGFVRGADVPSLIYYANGNSYLKRAEKEYRSGSTISVKISKTVRGTDV